MVQGVGFRAEYRSGVEEVGAARFRAVLAPPLRGATRCADTYIAPQKGTVNNIFLCEGIHQSHHGRERRAYQSLLPYF